LNLNACAKTQRVGVVGRAESRHDKDEDVKDAGFYGAVKFATTGVVDVALTNALLELS
jgi:hypothetical protein